MFLEQIRLFPEAFAQADDVLKGAVQGISDIIMKPGPHKR